MLACGLPLGLGFLLPGGILLHLTLTVSVFVSTVTQRTSSSFLVLLVIWIASVLIVPRAAGLLAGRAVEVP